MKIIFKTVLVCAFLSASIISGCRSQEYNETPMEDTYDNNVPPVEEQNTPDNNNNNDNLDKDIQNDLDSAASRKVIVSPGKK